MEPIEGSETSAFKTQTPGKYPKENILHKEHGESLKSCFLFVICIVLNLILLCLLWFIAKIYVRYVLCSMSAEILQLRYAEGEVRSRSTKISLSVQVFRIIAAWVFVPYRSYKWPDFVRFVMEIGGCFPETRI